MFVQFLRFDGPRSADLVEASRRAAHDRIEPLILADPELRGRLLGGFRAVASDGTETVVLMATDLAAFDEIAHIALSSDLLPGEDPALLPPPDRVEQCGTVELFGALADLAARAE